ncbi:hypothetical protein P5V15_011856 [Pogonomyrmex californicus]
MRILKQRKFKRRVQKQRFASDKTCAERIKLFLFFFKLCGLFVNELTAGRLKRCSWPIYSIGALWISSFISFSLYTTYVYMIMKSGSIRLTGFYFKQFIGYTYLCINVITAYFYQNHFIKFFDRLDSYDYEAVRMKNKRKDSLWVPWSMTFFMIVIILLIIYTIAKLTISELSVIFTLITDVHIFIMLVCSFLQMFLLLYLILERFKHLNKKIAPNVSWTEERRGPNAIKIMNVKIMHSLLYDAHRIFNDIYSIPLFLMFASLMMRIIANIFIFRLANASTAFSFIGPSIMLMLFMCTICHWTAEEANNIAIILSNRMTALVNSGKTTVKIDVLMYFLHNRVSFDAAGYFTINLPLFQSMIATLTTYIIILT